MKILYFAPIAFDELKQRPQQLAEELSKEHEVWYIEPTISLIGSLLKHKADYLALNYDVTTSLHVLRLNGSLALPIRLQLFEPLFLNTLYEKHQLKQLLIDCDIVWIGYEVWERLFVRAKNLQMIYDKMDDNVQLCQQKTIKVFLRKMEAQIIADANAIIVTAKKFYDELSGVRSHVYLIPNGIGFGCFSKSRPSVPVKTGKVFGYVGNISHWFDGKAIELIAQANPECEIALVGPCDQIMINIANVKYYGTVPKSDIPAWIDYFDICLYPFKPGTLLDTIDPVKIYEYLGLNKPVIAVDGLEMDKFGLLIYKYNNYKELVELTKRNFDRPFKNQEEVDLFITNNSWEKRGTDIKDILKDLRR